MSDSVYNAAQNIEANKTTIAPPGFAIAESVPPGGYPSGSIVLVGGVWHIVNTNKPFLVDKNDMRTVAVPIDTALAEKMLFPSYSGNWRTAIAPVYDAVPEAPTKTHNTPKKPRLYIAGPMTGYPAYNFPAFFEAEEFYAAAGFDVLNPARVDVETDGFDPRKDTTAKPPLSHAEYMERADNAVASCDAIVLLLGWENSVGARRELGRALDCYLAVWHRALMINPRDTPRELVATFSTSENLSFWAGELRKANAAKARAIHHPPPPETRVVDPVTGGAKGQKLERHDLIPPDVLAKLAEHYGKCGGNGADLPAKYEDRNWERGYRYSLSIAAAKRHLNKLERGIDVDPESNTMEAVCVAWHMFTLAAFQLRGIGTDDRVFQDGVFQPERVRPATPEEKE